MFGNLQLFIFETFSYLKSDHLSAKQIARIVNAVPRMSLFIEGSLCLLGLYMSQGWFVSLYLGRSSYASNQMSCFLKCCCRCQCHCLFPPHPTVSQLLIATTSSRQPMVSCAPPYFPIFISPVVWIHIWHEFVFLPWANCFYSARKRHIVRVMKREIFE